MTAITRPQARCVGPLRTIPHLFNFPTQWANLFRAHFSGHVQSVTADLQEGRHMVKTKVKHILRGRLA